MQAGVGAPQPGALDHVRFGVVDVETNGLSDRRHRILQIGLVIARADGTVLDRWSTYVRPRWWPVARLGPRHIHGITRAHLRDAPRLGEALDELGRRLDGVVLTAHNLRFDRGFLRHSAQRAGRDLPLGQGVCTLQMSRSLDPDRLLSHKLVDVCARYAVPLHRAHDALADAEATAGLLPHLLRLAGVSTPDHLSQLVEGTLLPPRS